MVLKGFDAETLLVLKWLLPLCLASGWVYGPHN